MRSLRLARLLPCLAALLLAACIGDGGPVDPQPAGPAAVRVAAGGGQADSVDAVLAAPLVAEVRDSSDVPLANVAVTFASAGEGGSTGVQFATAAEGAFAPTLVVRTDASGRAAARVKLPTATGLARARVTVGTLADSTDFQVSAGAALRLEVSPRDTTLYPGAFTLAVSARDRYGNASPVERTPSSRLVLEGQTVRAPVVGRHYVALRSGTLADTAWISAVPTGTLAVIRPVLEIVTLDGQRLNRLNVPAFSPAWSPDGTSIAVQTQPVLPGYIYSVHHQGGEPTLAVASPSAMSPEWETNNLIWFAGQDPLQSAQAQRGPLYRINRAGSQQLRITDPEAGVWHRRPSLAPAGVQVVFTRVVSPTIPPDGQPGMLTVYSLGSGVITPLGVEATEGRWSPAGGRIAFVSNGNLMVVNPDGSGVRMLASGVGGEIDWSPTGEYLVGQTATGLAVVVAATGEVIPLTFTDRTYTQPAWRP